MAGRLCVGRVEIHPGGRSGSHCLCVDGIKIHLGGRGGWYTTDASRQQADKNDPKIAFWGDLFLHNMPLLAV